MLGTGIQVSFDYPENHVEVWLVILFLSRKKFHTKQIFVATGFIKLGPAHFYLALNIQAVISAYRQTRVLYNGKGCGFKSHPSDMPADITQLNTERVETYQLVGFCEFLVVKKLL